MLLGAAVRSVCKHLHLEDEQTEKHQLPGKGKWCQEGSGPAGASWLCSRPSSCTVFRKGENSPLRLKLAWPLFLWTLPRGWGGKGLSSEEQPGTSRPASSDRSTLSAWEAGHGV